MDYQRSITAKDSRKSIDTAKTIFMQNGFAVTKKGDGEYEFSGPGMSSTKENPLTGVSKAHMRQTGHQLKLEAELGSVRGMQWFIWIFPFALGGILFLLFNVARRGESPINWASLWAVSPWAILSPLMSRWMKRRTVRALDVLIENAAQEE